MSLLTLVWSSGVIVLMYSGWSLRLFLDTQMLASMLVSRIEKLSEISSFGHLRVKCISVGVIT